MTKAARVIARLKLHHDAYGWARHCCGEGPVDPADVLQYAYLKVLRGKARRCGDGSLKTWWFGVIRLTAKEEQRRCRFRDSLAGKLRRFAPTEAIQRVAASLVKKCSNGDRVRLGAQPHQIAAVATLPNGF